MRLFVATGIFHPEPGGPATYLYHLLPEVVKRGHDVQVLTFSSGPSDVYPYRVTRIPRRALPIRWAHYWLAALPKMLWAELVFANGPDIPLPPVSRPRVVKVVGDPAWERATNRGWLPPGEDVDDFQRRRYSPAVEFFKWRRSLGVRSACKVIVPSRYLARMVIGWGAKPDRVSVIYNALPETEPPKFSQGVTRATIDVGTRPLPDPVWLSVPQEEARARLGLPAGPLFLMVARLTAWKGGDYLIRAMAALPGTHLVIAGDGPMRAEWEHLAGNLGVSDRVEFLGQVPRDELPLYFRAADYTVLYSGYEGLPHVALESLRAGTPVIASDKGGNPEVIQDGVNGLLAPWADQDALRATLRRAASDAALRKRLSEAAPRTLESFSWDALVKRTLAELESCLSG